MTKGEVRHPMMRPAGVSQPRRRLLPKASARCPASPAPSAGSSTSSERSLPSPVSAKRSTDLKTIRKPRRKERFHNHLYKVLRQVQGWDISISARAMGVMNEMANHSFDRIMEEASRLVRYSGKATLTEREVQMAVRLVVPGELARHADKFGTKRIDRSYKADYEDYECGSSNLEPLVEYEYEHY